MAWPMHRVSSAWHSCSALSVACTCTCIWSCVELEGSSMMPSLLLIIFCPSVDNLQVVDSTCHCVSPTHCPVLSSVIVVRGFVVMSSPQHQSSAPLEQDSSQVVQTCAITSDWDPSVQLYCMKFDNLQSDDSTFVTEDISLPDGYTLETGWRGVRVALQCHSASVHDHYY